MGNSVRTIESVEELVQAVELVQVHCYEVAAKRVPTQTEDEQPTARVGQRFLTGDQWGIESRLTMTLSVEDADLMADYSVIYHAPEPLEVSDDIAHEFYERVALFAVYPFVREGIYSMAERLGVDRPVMSMIRQGQIRVRPVESAQEAIAQTDSQD